MGIDDFGPDYNDSSDSGSGSSDSDSDSSDSGRETSVDRGLDDFRNKQWNSQLDFGSPYILVARNVKGTVYKQRNEVGLQVWEDRKDWRRLDDHPDEDIEVLYRCRSRRRWLRFRSRARDQEGVDIDEILNNDPERLMTLRKRVSYPSPDAPDQTRTCRVCGRSSDSSDCAVVIMDLQKHRNVALCEGHTVSELAEHGLLE